MINNQINIPRTVGFPEWAAIKDPVATHMIWLIE